MTKRLRFVTPALAVAALLTLAGCSAGGSPESSDPDPTVTLTQSTDGDGPTFETILPKNSTGASTTLRSEGKLTPGEPVDAKMNDAPDAGWIAQFACASDAPVAAEVLVNDEVVETIDVECEAATAPSVKFSGGGTITLRITGEGEGIYVSQLSKDPSV